MKAKIGKTKEHVLNFLGDMERNSEKNWHIIVVKTSVDSLRTLYYSRSFFLDSIASVVPSLPWKRIHVAILLYQHPQKHPYHLSVQADTMIRSSFFPHS